MTAPAQRVAAPRKLLLATDLGPGCDRALARAVSLARQWRASLLVVSVVDPAARRAQAILGGDAPAWCRAPDPLRDAERAIHRDMAGLDIDWTLHVEEGDPAEVLARIAAEAGSDLVITGAPHLDALGQVTLGSTLSGLLRATRLPLLAVRERVHAPYRHLLVASDLSDCSRDALETASALFPQTRMAVLNGFDVPMLGLLNQSRDTTVDDARVRGREALADFVATSALTGAHAGAVERIVERGDPARLLRQVAASRPVDLVVLGAHGRSAIREVAIGSVAKRILASVPVDALLVRSAAASAAPGSFAT